PMRWIPVFVLVGATSGTTLQPEAHNASLLHVQFVTTRERTGDTDPADSFNGKRNARHGRLDTGVCTVEFPIDYPRAHEASPFWTEATVKRRPKSPRLGQIDAVDPEAFLAHLSTQIGESPRNEALVFIHGFNISFEDAVLRTARFASDLGFTGAPILFSWPSRNSISGYAADESTADWSVPHLASGLELLVERTDADRIHLVAHSMGARILTGALMELEGRWEEPPFDTVILAAPDLDASVFETQVAPHLQGIAKDLVLYVSSNDRALKTSRRFHAYPRAGESGDDMVLIPWMTIVDVSAIDSGIGLNHNYYSDNRSVVNDIYHVIRNDLPPEARNLMPRERDGMRYWEFVP
ncbi:MAG: alpha/beta fold hydrolase, partial [Phycisphaerales bacterium]|nr:alpha/beta fold hydrolase [Phycisphaerales bacterium]